MNLNAVVFDLDGVITDDQGGRMFVCSDTAFCRSRQEGRS